MTETLAIIRDILLPIVLALGGVILLVVGFRQQTRRGPVIAGVILLTISLALYLISGWAVRPSQTAKATPSAASAPASTPSANPAAPTFTPTSAFQPTSVADVITMDEHGHTLRLIAAGTFSMGGGDILTHKVTIAQDYWMDIYEVTTRQYQSCVEAGICDPPISAKSATRSTYYGDTEFDYYPVVNVDWAMADTFCRKWRNGRLPSEAEWEYAARGSDGRAYPWGDAAPTCDLANFTASSPCQSDTQPVEFYPDGISPFGLFNMAGNVREWVADWNAPPASTPAENPTGPASDLQRVEKGGAWRSVEQAIRAWYRVGSPPDTAADDLGFRCVISR